MRRRRAFYVVLIGSPLLFYLFYVVLRLAPHTWVNKQSLKPELEHVENITATFLPNDVTSPFLLTDFNLPKTRNTSHETLGAILPISSTSGPHIESILLSLLNCRGFISQVGLVCSQDRIQEVRTILRIILSSLERINHVEFAFMSWDTSVSQASAMLRATSRIATDKIIFLTERGMLDLDQATQDLLLAGTFSLPFGPRGFVSKDKRACLKPLETTHVVRFVVPPFAASSSLLHSIRSFRNSETWESFGGVVAVGKSNGIGGVITGVHGEHDPSCSATFTNVGSSTSPDVQPIRRQQIEESTTATIGVVALVLPTIDDLQAFSRAACRLQEEHYKIVVLLYEQQLHGIQLNKSHIALEGCFLQCHVYRSGNTPIHLSKWLRSIVSSPDIVLAVDDNSHVGQTITSGFVSNHLHKTPTIIRLPRPELQYCDWIGSLTLVELTNWHMPHVQVTVITNDRPGSLARLFKSMKQALYFGDTLDLRINLEQDADPRTHKLVEMFRWEHGATFVSHRVVHGGLLPAVVESWYPHSNNSYGLLLEDDVELSPLFYAWVKMTLLRYRYGERQNKSPQLFGISLYQQKNIETRPEGRQPFNARTVFAAENLPAYDTPYLSQIPCSWGAVYFPEHWREFHSYLGVRLSELALSIDQVVVPEARSNRWTKSWKKYFIELVHLRGYVMFYPNFDQFISLSTNHLEVGSHVKDVPIDSYVQKKQSFSVPLMTLPPAGKDSMLLDIPGKRLPLYAELPTLDLFGDISNVETLTERGVSRHRILFPACAITQGTSSYDARHLFCVKDPVIQNTFD